MVLHENAANHKANGASLGQADQPRLARLAEQLTLNLIYQRRTWAYQVALSCKHKGLSIKPNAVKCSKKQ